MSPHLSRLSPRLLQCCPRPVFKHHQSRTITLRTRLIFLAAGSIGHIDYPPHTLLCPDWFRLAEIQHLVRKPRATIFVVLSSFPRQQNHPVHKMGTTTPTELLHRKISSSSTLVHSGTLIPCAQPQEFERTITPTRPPCGGPAETLPSSPLPDTRRRVVVRNTQPRTSLAVSLGLSLGLGLVLYHT